MNCGGQGHYQKFCPKRVNNKPSYKPLNADAKPFVPICHGCGEVGHIKPRCPKRSRQGNENAGGKTSGTPPGNQS